MFAIIKKKAMSLAREGTMTQKSKKQMEYTLSTHYVENLVPSSDAMSLCEQLTEQTISADAAVAMILRQYGLEKVSAHA